MNIKLQIMLKKATFATSLMVHRLFVRQGEESPGSAVHPAS